MSGPDPLLTTFEILLTIVTPLLALYLRGQWPLRTVTACLCGIAVLWYLTYAPIHELSHALGTVLVGGKVVDIKLIPSFWEGTFAVAWVTTEGLDQSWQQLVSTGAPYVIDVAFVVATLVVLGRRLSRNALVVGLLLMLLCLRPTFDLVCETVGFVGGFRGDLWHMRADHRKRGALVVPPRLTRPWAAQRRGHIEALRRLPGTSPYRRSAEVLVDAG